MIIKLTEDNANIRELEQLLPIYPHKAEVIESELRKLRAGAREENNVAHYLDRECGASKHSVILNDLRFEYRGQAFQIDHLIINRFLVVTLLETKSAKFGMMVDSKGNFSRSWKGNYQRIPSPIEQVRSQQSLLAEYLRDIDLFPKRLGLRLRPHYRSFVTISPTVNFVADPGFDASAVIRYDRILSDIENSPANFNIAGRLVSHVSYETIEEIAHTLVRHHVPKKIDWAARLKLTNPTAPSENTLAQTVTSDNAPPPAQSTCSGCGNSSLTIKYGRNYYFSCGQCEKNSPIKLPGPGKLRKQGNSFFYTEHGREDALFHINT